MLAARIDLLPAVEKAALQAAAVIGRVFWTGPVCELVEDGAPDFDLIEEREFIRRRAGSSLAGEQEYVIKHALTREVAYGSLLKAKRAPLHAGFAEWLERNGQGEDEHAPMLAHHYAEAVRPEDLDLAWAGREEEAERLRVQAVAWSRRAAELAVGRYEIDEGLALLHRALELEPGSGQQAELWHRIGRANALKFDGEAFWKAMEQALEIGGPSADVQTELAFQSVRRAGMWKREPNWDLVAEWIERALELAEDGSRNQARALYAWSVSKDDEASARALLAIGERLGDIELRSLAMEALADVSLASDPGQARAWVDQLVELVPALADPDDRTRSLYAAAFIYLQAGDLSAADHAVELQAQMAQGLTPHHRLHAGGQRIMVATLAGRWDVVRKLTPQGERAVEENLDAATPCPQNVSTLLYCAAANAFVGDEDEARRLEAKADAIGMEGYRRWFDSPRMRLAMARNDLAELERLVALEFVEPIESPAAFFDALVALGDRERIEAEAPRWLKPGIYVEPFALRALGVARGDRTLIRQALERFEAMELSWHAEQTQLLL